MQFTDLGHRMMTVGLSDAERDSHMTDSTERALERAAVTDPSVAVKLEAARSRRGEPRFEAVSVSGRVSSARLTKYAQESGHVYTIPPFGVIEFCYTPPTLDPHALGTLTELAGLLRKTGSAAFVDRSTGKSYLVVETDAVRVEKPQIIPGDARVPTGNPTWAETVEE